MDIDDLWFRRDGTPKPRCGKGKRYQARYRDPVGKQHGKAFNRKRDAELYLGKIANDVARDAYIDPAAGKVLLRDFAASWQTGLTSGPSTQPKIDTYLRNHILPGLGERPLSQIRPSVVSAWLAGLRRELSDGYVRQIRTTLSSLLSAAVEDGLIASNPCASRGTRLGKRPERKVVPWTAEQVAAVANAIVDELRALVITGAGEGLRQGELLGLAVEDVDFLHRVIHVRRQVKMIGGKNVFSLPKGEHTRDVPLSDLVGMALSRQIELHLPSRVTLPWEKPDGKPRSATLLFPCGREAWKRSAFDRRVWQPALKAAGIEWEAGSGDGCHALRHYAASVWLADGCSIREVAEYLGHSDPGFTLRTYTHLMPSAPDRMRRAADAALAAVAGHPGTTSLTI